MTNDEMTRKAVKIFQDPKGTVAMKIHFLTSKGMDMNLILEALDQATNGELARAVLADTELPRAAQMRA